MLQGKNLSIRGPRQTFATLAIPIAPHNLHPKCRSCVGIPGIGGQVSDCRCRNGKTIYRQLVHLRVRFVDANLFDRKDRIQQRFELAALTAASSIAGEPFDKIAVRMPAVFNFLRTFGTSGNGSSVTKSDINWSRRSDMPMVVSSAKSSASPVTCKKSACRSWAARSHVYCSCLSRQRVMNLVSSPSTFLAARKAKIEQRAVGVEYTGLHTVKWGRACHWTRPDSDVVCHCGD